MQEYVCLKYMLSAWFLRSNTIKFLITFSRLAQKCGGLVGDIGEDEIYAEYRKTKDLFDYLCKEYTKDCVKNEKQELWYKS